MVKGISMGGGTYESVSLSSSISLTAAVTFGATSVMYVDRSGQVFVSTIGHSLKLCPTLSRWHHMHPAWFLIRSCSALVRGGRHSRLVFLVQSVFLPAGDVDEDPLGGGSVSHERRFFFSPWCGRGRNPLEVQEPGRPVTPNGVSLIK